MTVSRCCFKASALRAVMSRVTMTGRALFGAAMAGGCSCFDGMMVSVMANPIVDFRTAFRQEGVGRLNGSSAVWILSQKSVRGSPHADFGDVQECPFSSPRRSAQQRPDAWHCRATHRRPILEGPDREKGEAGL